MRCSAGVPPRSRLYFVGGLLCPYKLQIVESPIQATVDQKSSDGQKKKRLTTQEDRKADIERQIHSQWIEYTES